MQNNLLKYEITKNILKHIYATELSSKSSACWTFPTEGEGGGRELKLPKIDTRNLAGIFLRHAVYFQSRKGRSAVTNVAGEKAIIMTSVTRWHG